MTYGVQFEIFDYVKNPQAANIARNVREGSSSTKYV